MKSKENCIGYVIQRKSDKQECEKIKRKSTAILLVVVATIVDMNRTANNSIQLPSVRGKKKFNFGAGKNRLVEYMTISTIINIDRIQQCWHHLKFHEMHKQVEYKVQERN